MKCKNCGAEVGREYRICPYCDSEIIYSTEQVQQPIIIQNVITNNVQSDYYANNPNNVKRMQAYSSKNKLLTFTLCIFLGYFGIHHFYVGKIGKGMLYLFTAGLFCFGWIYDIIKIASGTFKDGLGLPVVK